MCDVFLMFSDSSKHFAMYVHLIDPGVGFERGPNFHQFSISYLCQPWLSNGKNFCNLEGLKFKLSLSLSRFVQSFRVNKITISIWQRPEGPMHCSLVTRTMHLISKLLFCLGQDGLGKTQKIDFSRVLKLEFTQIYPLNV